MAVVRQKTCAKVGKKVVPNRVKQRRFSFPDPFRRFIQIIQWITEALWASLVAVASSLEVRNAVGLTGSTVDWLRRCSTIGCK